MQHELSTFECSTNNSDIFLEFLFDKKIGLSGAACNSLMDLRNFFVPINVYSSFQLVLNANETKEIQIGNIANFGNQKKKIQLDDVSLIDAVELTIEDNLGAPIFSGTWDKDTTNPEYSDEEAMSTLIDMIENDPSANQLITVSGTTSEILFTGKNDAFNFNVSASWDNAGSIEPISNSTIAEPQRYPNGAIKVLFLHIEYDETLDNNKKHIQYAYKKEYETGTFNWHNIGKIFFKSSDDDLLETDRNLLDTMILHNPTNVPVIVNTLIAS